MFGGAVVSKKKFNAHPFPYHHELELEIATLTNLGVGLARVSLPEPGSAEREGQSARRDLRNAEREAQSAPPAPPTSAFPNNQRPITNNPIPPAPTTPPAAEDSPANLQPSTGNPQPLRGWVVMVPFTLPGERVRARIYRNHKNYSEADLAEVLTPSPHRVAPPCPLFGRCGGCQYQHLAYSEQLQWKRRQVEELLRHMAGIEFPVAPTVPSPREYGYRSKITPHFSVLGRRRMKEGDGKALEPLPLATCTAAAAAGVPIGFLRQGSRFDLVDVPQCPIATPEINAQLTEVRAATRRKLAAGEYDRGATLLLRHAQEGVITDFDAVIHEVINLWESGAGGSEIVAGGVDPGRIATPPGSPPPATTSAGSLPPPSDQQLSTINPQLPRPTPPPLRLHFLARDFFQNNPFILPAFIRYVRTQAAATGARFLVDAYCGSGLFALACAPAFERVAGVELSATSVKFATENAAANDVTNASFRAGDAAQIFAGLDFPPAATVVVIDPPRKGCDESFLRQLFAFGPRAVVYVSCDPATQMRDLRGFLAAGYALRAVQPFDLFPQTRHLECVITLSKSG